MIGSIESLCRLLARHSMVPVVMLVTGVNTTPDPTHRATGFGGVLPVPSSATPATTVRIDPLLEQHRRDVRASRGRVLYAAGHGPQGAVQGAVQAAPTKASHKAPCPNQRFVQARAASASPTS
jgi:hypothetical protein